MVTSSEIILIRDGRVYDHDGDTDQPTVADILVEGTPMCEAGQQLPHEVCQLTEPCPRGLMIISSITTRAGNVATYITASAIS